MSSADLGDSGMFPYLYTAGLAENTAISYRKLECDGYECFVVACLYSSNIGDLAGYLEYGLDLLGQAFSSIKKSILDRMRDSIFESGDKLADALLEKNLPVEDVDYSVCFLAFWGGVFYLWIDGDLNLRIYRGNSSVLINSKVAPQFYGSGTVEVGDIFSVSFNKFLAEEDQNIEDYVLEKAQPQYPVFLLDYQLDGDSNLRSSFDTSGQRRLLVSAFGRIDGGKVGSKFIEVGKNGISKISSLDFRQIFQVVRDRFAFVVELVRNSGLGGKVYAYFLIVIKRFWNLLMNVSSGILDFIAGIIYRDKAHLSKRFKSSPRRVQLQYLISLVLILLIVFGVIYYGFRGQSTSYVSNQGNKESSQNDRDAGIKVELEKKYSALQDLAKSLQVDAFEKSSEQLKSDIQNVKNSGFRDFAYLDRLNAEIESLENVVYRITPITKVEEVFSTDHLPNVQIVDFALLGNRVYALDRANSQVLVSDSITQRFEVFASDSQLTGMTHITCVQKSCYIVDENVGMVVLDLETKSFSKFSALKSSVQGAKELASYVAGSTVYVYTLHPQESKVLRYARVGDGVTQPEKWNQVDGFGPNTTDLWVDGGIYEMSSDGVLRRFFGRNLDPSNVFGGLGTPVLPLSGDLQIAATPPRGPAPGVRNRFYVADSKNQRIAVFDRDLDSGAKLPFLGSFKYKGVGKINFGSFKEIALSGDEKSLYCLSDNQVFRVNVSAL